MTFYEPSRKLPITALVVTILIAGIGAIIFFSLKECRASGILRSGKSSDATNLYQVYPVVQNDQLILISLEGVYKTRIYERKGGMTTRSGSTDVRLTSHDLKTGKEIKRIVLGDYHESYTKILGIGKNKIWLYNAKDGLHSRNITDFEPATEETTIISSNKELSEGFAKADTYLGNVEELYSYHQGHDALMITTLSGKKIWISATDFKSVNPPELTEPSSNMDEMINEIMEQVQNGGDINMDALTSKIMEMAGDFSSFSTIEHLTDRVTGLDSCEYKFEGQTVRTIIKSGCPQNKISSNEKINPKSFIEPVFLSSYNPSTKQYTNPGFLNNNNCIVLHAKAIGSNTDLLMSLVDRNTKQPSWTIKTGIVLNNQRASYNVNAVFGTKDTLYVSLNQFLYAVKISDGKIIYKTTLGTGDYHEQFYFIGEAQQNGKKYFISANNYFTELSRNGIFVQGRTDYKISVIDALNGKLVKKMEVKDSKTEHLPYYLGMQGNNCWFYSVDAGIHTRTFPDLTASGDSFFELVKNSGINSSLVVSNGYDAAIENKYIAFDEKNAIAWFMTEDGGYYKYDLAAGKIRQSDPPVSEAYENFMKENSRVKFYRTHLSNMYHHELFFNDGYSAAFLTTNSVSTLQVKDNKQEDPKTGETELKTNQFIEGKILANGVYLTGEPFYTSTYATPLSVNKESDLYIFHKDKISPEAHSIISRYDVNNEKVLWKVDINELLLTGGEIERIYVLNEDLIIIFKTHPDLDDFFTCASIQSRSGKLNWSFKF